MHFHSLTKWNKKCTTVMNKSSKYLEQALALQQSIMSSPEIWLPRRDSLLEWLNNFVKRAESSTFVLGETEAADLADLELFISKKKIQIA
jgi:hypothetical protein